MRDDVKEFFNKLLKHLDSKKTLLNSLLEKESSVSDLVKYRNDAEDEILKIIEYETSTIEQINVLDFHISGIKDEITKRYSFDFNKLFMPGYRAKEYEIDKFKTEVVIHQEIINKIIILKTENNLMMQNRQKDLSMQIDELERIGRLRYVIPKDPQSF